MKNHKLSIVLLLLLIPSLSRAQYFDWVERYTGSEASGYQNNTNDIRSCVVDNNGNLYFSGRCSVDAGFRGNIFLPMSPYGSEWNTSCGVIGKISADGNLVWSKIVHGNGHSHGIDNIQLLGDSLIFSYIPVYIPHSYPRDWSIQTIPYVYYLDTLMYFYEGDSIVHNGCNLYNYNFFFNVLPATAYVVFDLNGNIVEQHWLTVALLNSEREPFNVYDQIGGNLNNKNILLTNGLSVLNTIFDNDGNIVLIRQMRENVSVNINDTNSYAHYDIQSPEVSGLRIYVDGKRYFDIPLPDVRPSTGYNNNYQILKFSPHFDSLLASQFLFEPTLEHLDTICEIQVNDLKCAKDGNVYLVANSDYNLSATGEANSLKIGGSDSLCLHFHSYDSGEGFFVKYDTMLNPVYLRQYERDTSIVLNGNRGLSSAMWGCQFDDDGILTILGGASSMDSSITSCYFDTTEVELNKTFIRVNPENGTVVNQAVTVSAEQSSFGGGGAYFTDFEASGNRLIWQFKYRWWLDFADSLYEKPEKTQWGMGFAVWDYDGNELYFVDYGVNGSVNNGTRSMCLQDSVLYLTGMLASGGAQFGDITVPNAGASQSFIARYVDTAFMHPYVQPGSQQDIQLVVRDGEPVVTVYPNPCTQRVTVDWDGEEPLASAFVTDISGRSYDIILKAAGQGRYTVDFSSMPPANYLLTLVTASGHRITSRLLKR